MIFKRFFGYIKQTIHCAIRLHCPGEYWRKYDDKLEEFHLYCHDCKKSFYYWRKE